uniref:Probable RNA polymerase II nuclear localization protein SLC7A6OS n=1 Tax=Anopheles marajoara TaxID=58244 RepID=A0A2M4BSB5_9DIPT
MTTVIRLKRRVDEDPLNAFVLNCKRQRVEAGEPTDDPNANAAESSTILKFAGTFSQAEGIASHLQNIHKDQAKDAISRVHRPNIKPRNRAAAKQIAQNDRFRIVNCTRSITNETESTVDGIPTTIVDVERDDVRLPEEEAAATVVTSPPSSSAIDVAEPHAQQQSHQLVETFTYENGVRYVYDLYVADTSQHHNTAHSPYYTDNLDDLSVMVCDDPLYSLHRGDLDSDDSSDSDSEDSNAEDNWRNEYPDEEDDVRSIGEEDMRRAVEEIDLDGDRSLSSDDGEEAFVYPPTDGVLYTDEEEDSLSDIGDVNRDDVKRYGTAYARYKARILRELEGRDGESSSSSSEENFDLYD